LFEAEVMKPLLVSKMVIEKVVESDDLNLTRLRQFHHLALWRRLNRSERHRVQRWNDAILQYHPTLFDASQRTAVNATYAATRNGSGGLSANDFAVLETLCKFWWWLTPRVRAMKGLSGY